VRVTKSLGQQKMKLNRKMVRLPWFEQGTSTMSRFWPKRKFSIIYQKLTHENLSKKIVKLGN